MNFVEIMIIGTVIILWVIVSGVKIINDKCVEETRKKLCALEIKSESEIIKRKWESSG